MCGGNGDLVPPPPPRQLSRHAFQSFENLKDFLEMLLLEVPQKLCFVSLDLKPMGGDSALSQLGDAFHWRCRKRKTFATIILHPPP